jgi:hypothetical protein
MGGQQLVYYQREDGRWGGGAGAPMELNRDKHSMAMTTEEKRGNEQTGRGTYAR